MADYFIFDTQGEIPYTPTPKKGGLITSPTVITLTTGRVDVSLGRYGFWAGSDISDDLMFIDIPPAETPMVVQGPGELRKQAIADSRAEIYLPLQKRERKGDHGHRCERGLHPAGPPV